MRSLLVALALVAAPASAQADADEVAAVTRAPASSARPAADSTQAAPADSTQAAPADSALAALAPAPLAPLVAEPEEPAPARAPAPPAAAPRTSDLARVRYDVANAPAYYAVTRGAAVRADASDEAPLLATLRPREGVRSLAETVVVDGDSARWHLVDHGGRRGWMRAEDLSNVWVRVDKSERTTYVYRGAELVRTLPADVSIDDEDKVRRSRLGETEHYRMPEGTFFVTRLNGESEYYRAFVLSYPGPAHALRGFESGLITRATYEAIVAADLAGEEPPMNTALGGLIEIHGQGSGRRQAWTRGCVALRNVHMDELWDVLEVGTPVVIEP